MAGGASSTTPTLIGPKISSFMIKALYFQSSGQTNICQIEVLFKWSEQSCTPSAAPGPSGSGMDHICSLVPNGSTYEGDPTWNHTVPV